MSFEGRNTTSGLFTPGLCDPDPSMPRRRAVKYVFLSVNIDTNHWICLVIDLDAKKIYVYDSVKSRIISKVMAGLAKKLMRQVLKDKYTEQVIKTPTQKDCNSCGIFVCRYFGLCDSSEAPTDLTPTGIERLRCMGTSCLRRSQRGP
ncbi:Ulp1 protease family, C-terminal catalytic domain [Phytophthora cactorum]|nr:Ulp1 protease family, C-terminal catalytic domain [Phytophthora cactorum]